MKPRKWLLVVVILFILICSSVLVGKFFLEKNRNLESFVIQNISTLFEGTFTVDKVRLGFFSVYLTKVNVSIPVQNFALSIQDIKIGFSFFQFLKSRGDIVKSINKIIILNPIIDIFLQSNKTRVRQKVILSELIAVGTFPVQHLLIKNGLIRMTDFTHNSIVLGERLSGKLGIEKNNLSFDLRGKLASKKRNLFISGLLSDVQESQYISIRIQKAYISKPIKLQNFSIVNGKIDGVCELSFTDTIFPHNLEVNGQISIENGLCTVNTLRAPVENVNTTLSLSGQTITIDTLSAQWKSVNLFCKGTAGIFNDQEQKISVVVNGLEGSLIPDLPDPIQNSLSGSGWFEGTALKKPHTDHFEGTFSLGGFSIARKPFRRILGKCHFEQGYVTIDTAFVEYSGYSTGIRGMINFEKSPAVYSFTFNTSGNLEQVRPDLTGLMMVRGTIHGLGKKPIVSVKLLSSGLSFSQIPLGSPVVSLKYQGGDTIVFQTNSLSTDALSFKGTIGGLNSNNPGIKMKFSLNNELFEGISEKFSWRNTKFILPASFDGDLLAERSGFAVHGFLHTHGSSTRGTCLVDIDKKDSVETYNWAIASKALKINNKPFSFTSMGRVSGETVYIDTLNIENKIESSGGTLTVGNKKSILVELLCKEITHKDIKHWLPSNLSSIDKGIYTGKIKLSGDLYNPDIFVNSFLSECSVYGISSLETNVILMYKDKSLTMLPFVIRKDKKVLFFVDTIFAQPDSLSLTGTFHDIDLKEISPNFLDNTALKGSVSGSFRSMKSGLPIRTKLYSEHLTFNRWGLDSVFTSFDIVENGITIDTLYGCDSVHCHVVGSGFLPWSFLENGSSESDTLHTRFIIKGDILRSVERNFPSAIGGTGVGEIVVDFSLNSENWFFREASATISTGVLTVTPFVPDNIKDISLSMTMDNNAMLHTKFSGTVNGRPVQIESTPLIPKGLSPLYIGPVNCGVITIKTPKKGIHLYLPGFMEEGIKADIEFAPILPFPLFTVSGPLDRLRISGTWLIRSTEFTFPLLDTGPPPEDDPFPFITWDLRLKAGNRKVLYFYNLGRKHHKFIRFVECTVDPSTSMRLEGREADGTYRLLGSLRSYKGYVFYGKYFDRNFTLGVEFSPQKKPGEKVYNNLPIIWGSAETFSDSSRFDRIKLTLLTRDSLTGFLREKGRFYDIAFRISSEFEEIPGESEKEFYREAGLRFITLKGAGEVVSGFGDQYLRRYLFQRFERKLAKRLGLDVISFETTIASNYFSYFYGYQENRIDFSKQWNYLTFANVGITLGRYFLHDRVFVKWRTEFIPNDLILVPEHSVGFEYQPIDFFWIDFNYAFFKNEDIIEYNPKLLMQLRIPIHLNKSRNKSNFKEN